MAVKFFDQKATGTMGQPDFVPSKQGLFSALGGILSNVAVGLQNPTALAELQQRNAEAEQNFQKYLAEAKLKREQAINPGEKPIFTVGTDGNLMQVGTVPKGSQVVPNPNAPTADMKNAGVAAEQAKVLWEDLKSQSEGLKGGYQGIIEMGKAAITRGAGKSGDYKLYTDNLPSSAVGLYRALTGDTRLSDADAKARALPLLWEPSQDESLRTKKNAFIDRMIGARERLLNSGKYKDGVVPLSDLKKAASNSQTFQVNGKTYNIPSDKVDAFKKDMGIK